MIKENSGKIYRFKLDHNFGFGFAEVYDFTDLSVFDGRIVYVYNRVDILQQKYYDLNNIIKSGVAIGPIRLVSFPGTRGKYAAKLIGQNNDFIIDKIPITKEYQGLLKESNWNSLNRWHRSDRSGENGLEFLDYSKVRELETRVLSHIAIVSTKFTMKQIIDKNKKVSDYYDLNEIGNFNVFAQLINTYYSLNESERLINVNLTKFSF